MATNSLAFVEYEFEAYHIAWLSAHPERTGRWLKDMLRDGFHVHHVDGDHSNDDPSNLVLIDGTDHMRLHGMKLLDGIQRWRGKKKLKPVSIHAPASKPDGSVIYAEKVQSPGTWVEFAKAFYSGVKPTDGAWHDIGARLSMKARKYAMAQGKPWPPGYSNE